MKVNTMTHTGHKFQRVSISVPEPTIEAARELKINTSQAAAAGIDAAVKREKERQWLEKNRAALDHHNTWIAEHGLPLAPKWAQ